MKITDGMLRRILEDTKPSQRGGAFGRASIAQTLLDERAANDAFLEMVVRSFAGRTIPIRYAAVYEKAKSCLDGRGE